MVSEGASFLPRIQSIFYAVFDNRQGPKIVYQVPEGLISVPISGLSSSQSGNPPSSASSIPATPATDSSSERADQSGFSTALSSPLGASTTSRSVYTPPRRRRSTSLNKTLFNFEEISRYVIPPGDLCGRLVICTARNYKIIGSPVNLMGNYERYYFTYNLCFVFERTADLSCYEPILRKVTRVLTACEEESAFLSSPQTSPRIHAILEQLYEDLNSYSETSIAIDNFNSINLKIFPFYPNPSEVKDWAVPIALINLTKRIESNWDLTTAKICQYIDGTNHVSRIAHLADCDLDLTRQAISHLLYYQVIMTIDIFQYSNIYTLRKSIQWLADEPGVKEECGPYVTKPGQPVPGWPTILHGYSRFKLGKTVLEWMEECEDSDAIDVRRFTSFGVIKGFLRRVHRWPIMLPAEPVYTNGSTPGRGRRRSVSSVSSTRSDPPRPIRDASPHPLRSRPFQPTPPNISVGTDVRVGQDSAPTKRSSAAETVLERLHRLDIQQSGSRGNPISPFASQPVAEMREVADIRKPLTVATPTSLFTQVPPLSTLMKGTTMVPSLHVQATPIPARARPSRSSSLSQSQRTGTPAGAIRSVPRDFVSLLDGEHHTDELAARFEVGWPVLRLWLLAVGGGKGDDYGRVVIIYQ